MLYVIYQLKLEIFCLYETVSLFENKKNARYEHAIDSTVHSYIVHDTMNYELNDVDGLIW